VAKANNRKVECVEKRIQLASCYCSRRMSKGCERIVAFPGCPLLYDDHHLDGGPSYQQQRRKGKRWERVRILLGFSDDALCK
jgi:hypothetical protein